MSPHLAHILPMLPGSDGLRDFIVHQDQKPSANISEIAPRFITKSGRPNTRLQAALREESEKLSRPVTLGRAGGRAIPSRRPLPGSEERHARSRLTPADIAPGGPLAAYRRPGRYSVEETLLAVYHAALSVRAAEQVARNLWGCGLGRIGEQCRRLEDQISAWLNRPLERGYPYLFLDEIRLKQRHPCEPRRLCLLRVVGVNARGFREVLGAIEGREGDERGWRALLLSLKHRGLAASALCTCPWPSPMLDAVGEIYPAVRRQYCVDRFRGTVLAQVPPAQLLAAANLVQHIHDADSGDDARERARRAASRLHRWKLHQAAALIEETSEPTLAYYGTPRGHWPAVRSDESRQRLAREIRQCVTALGSVADGGTAVLFAGARLRQLTRTSWARHRYLCLTDRAPPLHRRDA